MPSKLQFYTRQGDVMNLTIPDHFSGVKRGRWISKMKQRSSENLAAFAQEVEKQRVAAAKAREEAAVKARDSVSEDSDSDSDCEDMSDSELAQALAPASREPKMPAGWVVHDHQMCHLESGFRCCSLPPPDFDPFAHSAPLRPNWILYQDEHNRPYYCHEPSYKQIWTRPTERDSPPPMRKPAPKKPEPKKPEPKKPEPVDQKFAMELEQALQLSIEDAVSTKEPDRARDRRHNRRADAAILAQAEAVRSAQEARLVAAKAAVATTAPKSTPKPQEPSLLVADKAAVEVEEDDECVICMNAKADHVTVPCGHQAYCADCVPEKPDKCPMCRGPLTMVMKIFKR